MWDDCSLVFTTSRGQVRIAPTVPPHLEEEREHSGEEKRDFLKWQHISLSCSRKAADKLAVWMEGADSITEIHCGWNPEDLRLVETRGGLLSRVGQCGD